MDLSQLLQQTVSGAATGTAVEPGWGTLIGAGAGLGMGILGQANKPKVPPLDDNNQADLAAFLQDYNYKLQNRQNQQQLAQTQQNVLRSGSNMSAVQGGLNAAQQTAGSNSNKATAGLLKQQDFFTQLAEQSIDDMSKRKYDLQFNDYLQKLREKSELQQGLTQSVMAASGFLAGKYYKPMNNLAYGQQQAMGAKITTPTMGNQGSFGQYNNNFGQYNNNFGQYNNLFAPRPNYGGGILPDN